jgi:hypothetical protein
MHGAARPHVPSAHEHTARSRGPPERRACARTPGSNARPSYGSVRRLRYDRVTSSPPARLSPQALLLCVFEPATVLLGLPLNPISRQLLPAAVLLLAGGAGLFLLTGLVADGGQVRSLQQALLQVQLMASGGATAIAAGSAESQKRSGRLGR